MKKIIALMLSLMLLIGCVGSAEIEQATLNVTFMGDQLVNATIAHGVDADGCESVSVDAAAMGQVISAMAQQTDTWYTVKVGEQAYTLTVQNIAKAVSLIASQVEAAYGINFLPESLNTLLPVIAAYNAADVQVFEAAAMTEVNRLMGICQAQGIVAIAEDGTLTVQADVDGLIAVVTEYLNELAADEAELSALAATNMWAAAGLPDAATCAQYVSAIAEQFAGITSEAIGVTGRLYLVVEPAGSMSGEFTYAVGEYSIAAQFGYSAEGYNLAYDATVNGNTISCNYVVANGHISMYESANGITYAYTADLSEDGTAIDLTVKFDAGEGMQYDATATINADYSFNAVINANGVEYDAQGTLTVWDNAYEYGVKVTSGNEVLAAYTYGISVNVYEDMGTMYSLYLRDDLTQTDMYMAQLTINNYIAKVALYEGENVVFEAEGGITMMDENNLSAYVSAEGVQFVLTASKNDTVAMASIDYGMVGGEMTNLATLNLTLVDENTVAWDLTYNGVTYNGNVYYNPNEMNAYVSGAASIVTSDGVYSIDIGTLGIKGNGSNQMVLYVVSQGMEYDLTLTINEVANGVGISGSLDVTMADSEGNQATQNIGTADMTYAITEGDFAHIDGTEITGEDIAAIVLGMLGMTGTTAE